MQGDRARLALGEDWPRRGSCRPGADPLREECVCSDHLGCCIPGAHPAGLLELVQVPVCPLVTPESWANLDAGGEHPSVFPGVSVQLLALHLLSRPCNLPSGRCENAVLVGNLVQVMLTPHAFGGPESGCVPGSGCPRGLPRCTPWVPGLRGARGRQHPHVRTAGTPGASWRLSRLHWEETRPPLPQTSPCAPAALVSSLPSGTV